MELNIQDIRIEERIRRDIGDLSGLKESLKHYGMLNPIIVSHDNTLIAGFRRLQAAKEIGWTSVQVRRVSNTDEADLVEMEIDENLHRKAFTDDEETDAFLRLERLRRPSLWKRISLWFQRLFARIRSLFRRY